MNRLTQAGLGFGLTAGIVLFPQPAGAEATPQYEVAQYDASATELASTNSIEGPMSIAGARISDVLTPDISALVPEISFAYGETGQDNSDYCVPLALVIGAAVVSGVIVRKISKNIIKQRDIEDMYGELATYSSMDIDTFSFVARSFFNLPEEKDE